jgi:hypothetical protein
LLTGTLCFLKHFAFWNCLLPRTIYCLEFASCNNLSTPLNTGKTVASFEVKCSKEQSVSGSKVSQEAKCFREETVLRSKVFQEAKCVKE